MASESEKSETDSELSVDENEIEILETDSEPGVDENEFEISRPNLT
jgi:hypothetical protein